MQAENRFSTNGAWLTIFPFRDRLRRTTDIRPRDSTAPGVSHSPSIQPTRTHQSLFPSAALTSTIPRPTRCPDWTSGRPIAPGQLPGGVLSGQKIFREESLRDAGIRSQVPQCTQIRGCQGSRLQLGECTCNDAVSRYVHQLELLRQTLYVWTDGGLWQSHVILRRKRERPKRLSD